MGTTVGLVHLELNVAQAMSLKDKRRVLKSLKDRLGRAHNVSVAEVDHMDKPRWAVLAVTIVGNDKHYLEAALQKIINTASRQRDMVLVNHETEWL